MSKGAPEDRKEIRKKLGAKKATSSCRNHQGIFPQKPGKNRTVTITGRTPKNDPEDRLLAARRKIPVRNIPGVSE
jgi:hypothetical protein